MRWLRRKPSAARERSVLHLTARLNGVPSSSGARWRPYDVSYRWDIVGRLTEVVAPFGRVTYAYSAANEVRRLLPNGVTSIFQYSPDGQLTDLRHTNRDGGLIAAYHSGRGRSMGTSLRSYSSPSSARRKRTLRALFL